MPLTASKRLLSRKAAVLIGNRSLQNSQALLLSRGLHSIFRSWNFRHNAVSIASERLIYRKRFGAMQLSRSKRKKALRLKKALIAERRLSSQSKESSTTQSPSPGVFLSFRKESTKNLPPSAIKIPTLAPLLTSLRFRLRPMVGLKKPFAPINKLSAMLVRASRTPRRTALAVSLTRLRAKKRGVLRIRGRLVLRKGRRFRLSTLRKLTMRFRLRSSKAISLSKVLSRNRTVLLRKLRLSAKFASYSRTSSGDAASFGFTFRSFPKS